MNTSQIEQLKLKIEEREVLLKKETGIETCDSLYINIVDEGGIIATVFPERQDFREILEIIKERNKQDLLHNEAAIKSIVHDSSPFQ